MTLQNAIQNTSVQKYLQILIFARKCLLTDFLKDSQFLHENHNNLGTLHCAKPGIAENFVTYTYAKLFAINDFCKKQSSWIAPQIFMIFA